MTPQDFVAKWNQVRGKEIANAQPHFLDLCDLLGKPKPQPNGEDYTFEESVQKATGGAGRADVWKRACFAWEYKGPGRNLDKAYSQLLQYKDALDNPPLLIVSDILTIQVHTNFTNSVKRVHTFTLDDLLDPKKLEVLGRVFDQPETFRVDITPDDVTKAAAVEFAKLADILRDQGEDPHRAAHYLIRLLFCLFAEDAGLLPNNVFTKLVDATKDMPEHFTAGIRQMFAAMSKGGLFGFERIPHFNGRLFDDDQAVPLSRNGIRVLSQVAKLDWSSIEPSIFGTLFERSLDPSKRAQLGAHYTPRSDIELVVEPVLMAPLRRKWATVQADALALAATRDNATAQQRTKIDNQLTQALLAFMRELATIRVLDPACGSGNFLYVALLLLLDLWKEVWVFMGELGLQRPMALEDVTPSPTQLHGIEINEFAAELAQVTIWIGYIQWLRDNGFGTPAEPILKPLDTIENRDAILAYDAEGRPVEPEWPAAEVIVGNPPFLGRSQLRNKLGNEYVAELFTAYDRILPRASDLCCYWFERARVHVKEHASRVGLLATQAIRAGKSRRVLDRILDSGDVFFAESDRPWILDGASVRVSMVGFDSGVELERTLDGIVVTRINADLTAVVDLTSVQRLHENADISARGTQKRGAFDIDADTARFFLQQPVNPNGRTNADVIVPLWNGQDVTGRPREMWIVDFGPDSTQEEAAGYELPFEYVKKHVQPTRMTNNDPRLREKWWLHGITQPAMRNRIKRLHRFCVTPRVAKHRLFVWLTHPLLPDDRLFVFARDDDYFFGVLHSRPHEVWSLATSSRHGVGNDPTYNTTTCFETFPFPWPPGHEPTADPRVTAIADAARDLVEKRDRWLNPEGASEAELKKRTLTNLYNQRPTWLDLAHKRLDAAVLDAYGWPHDISDEAILERLLALNLERAAASDGGGQESRRPHSDNEG